MHILWLTIGPPVVALVCAGAAWLRDRRHAQEHFATRLSAVIPAGVSFVLLAVYEAEHVFPRLLTSVFVLLSDRLASLSFTLPLVLTALMLVVRLLTPRAKPHTGSADLQPRTPFAFAHAGWFVALGLALVLVIGLSVAAGLASVPDEEGAYRMYWVRIGSVSAGTTIYGWYYSLPCLALMAGIVVLCVVAMLRISHPPYGTDRQRDIARRRLETRDVLAIGLGGTAAHLAAILDSLASTSQVTGGANTGSLGPVSAGTPFAALGPALSFAGALALIAALGLWAFVALCAIRSPALRHPSLEAART